MQISSFYKSPKSQTAIEYLLLFTVTAVIVFAAFKSLVPRAQTVSNQYYSEVAVGIMGEPPPIFVAAFNMRCVAYPREHPSPGGFASCSNPVYPNELLRYTTGDALCGGDEGANVTICCDKTFPTINVISVPVWCSPFGPSYTLPACSGTYSSELLRWCSENCDWDDAQTRFCIRPGDAAGLPSFYMATGSQGTRPGCSGGTTELVSWCEGNNDADDACNTMCYSN